MSADGRRVHDISDSEDSDSQINTTEKDKKTISENTPTKHPGPGSPVCKTPKRSPPEQVKNGLEKNVDILKKRKLNPGSSLDRASDATLATIIKEANDPGDRDSALCRYGSMCYQTNAAHLASFSHPNRGLGFYLTKCEGINAKFNTDTFTRSLKQVLHEDVGDELESAVHFSYVYDMEWLIEQYPRSYRSLPMMLVVQQSKDLLDLLIAQRQEYRNVFLLPIELSRFGTHHTKMISLKYKNSLRLIVTTANLYGPDWGRKSQMLWVSPLLKKVESKKGPDSATGFRSSLCSYLRSYQKRKLLDLAESYADYDFSSIQSYFIGSSPNSPNSGLLSLESVLKKTVAPVSSNCPVTFCFSSIGTLGSDDTAWLCPVFGKHMLSTTTASQISLDGTDITKANIQPIYPTVEEVRRSLEGYEAGRSLPYSGKTHMRQRWSSQWFHHWKADNCGRTRAAPHVKFYIRTSEDYKETYWFLMTSANLSKAAWGNSKTKAPLSFEGGILHVPKSPVKTANLVVPFDLPPERYKSGDRLWIQDAVYGAPDDYGNAWDPRKGGAVEIA